MKNFKTIKKRKEWAMTSYQIKKLYPEDYNKCSNIWDMEKKPKIVKMFYADLVSRNRITFIYAKNNEFIGEGSLVFKNNDPDYSIPDKQIYLSRMIDIKILSLLTTVTGLILAIFCKFSIDNSSLSI